MLNELVLAQTLLGQRERAIQANEQRVDQLVAKYGDLDAAPQQAGLVDRVVLFAKGLRPQPGVATATLDGSPAAA
ncbi:MAG: hypothetical protein AB7V46_12300 [Thermomicrobiales bacterium]